MRWHAHNGSTPEGCINEFKNENPGDIQKTVSRQLTREVIEEEKA